MGSNQQSANNLVALDLLLDTVFCENLQNQYDDLEKTRMNMIKELSEKYKMYWFVNWLWKKNFKRAYGYKRLIFESIDSSNVGESKRCGL